jgi:hypothetical protein
MGSVAVVGLGARDSCSMLGLRARCPGFVLVLLDVSLCVRVRGIVDVLAILALSGSRSLPARGLMKIVP